MFSFPLVGDFPPPIFPSPPSQGDEGYRESSCPPRVEGGKGRDGGKPFSHGMGEERGGEKWRGEKRFPLITQCTAAYMKYIL